MKKFWTDEQYAHANREQLQKYTHYLETERQANMETFSHEMEAKAAWQGLTSALAKGQEGMRWLTGRAIDLYEGNDWTRNFKYNSLPLSQGYATYINGVFEALKSYHGGSLASPALPVAKVLARAAAYTAQEHAAGFPWAHAHADKVEEYSMNTLDPMWAASWFADGIKAAGGAIEASRLVPYAEKLIAAKGTEGAVGLIAKPLWGADATRQVFVDGLKEILKLGGTAEDLAKWMYHEGFRTPEWAKASTLPLSQYFKRGNNIASPGLMDRLEQAFSSFYEKGKTLEQLTGSLPKGELPAELRQLDAAMKAEHQGLLDVIKKTPLTDHEAQTIQWALHNIPRDQYEPVKSFALNYAKAVKEGTAPAVEPELFDKMQQAVKVVSSGWRDGSAWRSAYGPGLRTASRINLGLEPVASAAELADRPWRLQQTQQGVIESAENFQQWLAHVGSREKMADMAEELLKKTEAHVENLKASLSASGNAGKSLHGSSSAQETFRGPLSFEEELEASKPQASQLWHNQGSGSSPARVTDIPEIVKIRKPALEVAERYAQERGVKATPEFSENLYRELHDVLHDIGDPQKSLQERKALYDKAKKEYPTIEADFQKLQGFANLEKLGYYGVLKGAGYTPHLQAVTPRDLELAQQFANDLKGYVKSPEFIKYKASEIINPLVAAYDYTLSLMKTAMLKWTPGFYVHRLTDMGGMRSLAMAGESHVWDTLKAGLTRDPAPVRDIFGSPFHVGTKFETAMGIDNGGSGRSLIGSMDQEAINHIARHSYNDAIADGIKQGFDLKNPESAKALDRMAKAKALKDADFVHGIYHTDNAVSGFFDRTHFFWRHYLGRATFWGTKAIEHPSEAYALTKLRELQQDHSVDRKGALRIPGTYATIDPLRRLTPLQVMEPAVDPQYFMKPGESAQYIPGRAMKAIMGDWTPPLSMILEDAKAIPPAGERPMSDVENLIGMATKAVAGERVLPSDPLQEMLGRHPEETRQDFENRTATLFKAAADRDGLPITPQQAQERAQRALAGSQALSFARGQPIHLGVTPGMEQVMGAMKDYREQMLAAPPELRPALHQVLLSRPEYEGLERAVPLDPQARFNAINRKVDLESARSQTHLANPVTPTEQEQRSKDTEDVIKSSKLFRLLGPIYNRMVPEAGATETIGPNPQAQDKPRDWQKDSNGRVVPKTDGTPQDNLSAARDLSNYQMAQNALKLPSVQAVHDYVAGAKDMNGFNPILDNLKRVAQVDAGAQASLDAYNYVENKGGAVRGDLPMSVSRNVDGIASAYKSFVAHAGPEAQHWVDASPQEVRQAVASGRIPKAIGTDLSAYDDYAIKSAQQGASNLVGIAMKQWKQDQAQKFPEDEDWKVRLQSANARAPQMVSNYVDQINDGIKQGSVSPDFWKGMVFGDKDDRKLFHDTSVTDRYETISKVRDAMVISQNGRPVGISTAALSGEHDPETGETLRPGLIAQGYGPDIAAMRLGAAGPQVAQLLNDPQLKPFLDQNAPVDPRYIGDTLGNDFLMRVGLQPHDLSAHLLDHQVMVNAPERVVGGPQSSMPAQESSTDFSPAPKLPTTPLEQPAQQTTNFSMSATPRIPMKMNYSGGDGTISMPTIVPDGTPYGGIKLPANDYRNSGEWISDTIAQHRQAVEQLGDDAPSIGSVGMTLAHGMDANTAANTAGAVAQLGRVSESLGLVDRASDVGRSVSGLSTALSTFGAVTTITGNPIVGAVVGGIAGISQGLLEKHQDTSYRDAQLKMAQERFALQQEQHAENLQRVSATNVAQREQALIRSSTGGISPTALRQLAPTLQAFQRRPTFASRVGMIDQLERSLGSALTPRW